MPEDGTVGNVEGGLDDILVRGAKDDGAAGGRNAIFTRRGHFFAGAGGGSRQDACQYDNVKIYVLHDKLLFTIHILLCQWTNHCWIRRSD